MKEQCHNIVITVFCKLGCCFREKYQHATDNQQLKI